MAMRLIILHYHLRPGGIRRIIELATPELVRHFGGALRQVVIATGETGDPKWKEDFVHQLDGTSVEFFVERAFGYLSEQRATVPELTKRIRLGLDCLLKGSENERSICWAHNLGVGRNLIFTRELSRACERRGLPLLAHHHDWWFDNRWLRWPQMRRFGCRTLMTAARTVFPPATHIRHLTINQADARLLKRHFGKRVAWLPNLTENSALPSPARVTRARNWLREKLPEPDAPIWILPCRLLRRKNVAEALLLTRWLRPMAWLVTTGGVSSAEERAYLNRLESAARQNKWPVRIGVLAEGRAGQPSVSELLAVSECVLLTSAQEGFGLPYLEAAVARRPLIARALPNIAPDLARFGFRFPQYYQEVLIPPGVFNWEAEVRRQHELFQRWQRQLPRASRPLAGIPFLLRCAPAPEPVPFSRLTLTAQLEILTLPASESWERCIQLNPFLAEWKERATKGALEISRWPRCAGDYLSGAAYARRWAAALARQVPKASNSASAIAAQQDFISWKLRPEYLYPLLWATKT